MKDIKRTGRVFSNGRFVRNIFEKSKMNQALRIGSMEEVQDDDYRYLYSEDILDAYRQEKQYKGFSDKKQPMGFIKDFSMEQELDVLYE